MQHCNFYPVPVSGEKIVGGCATVAGWGYRHDLGDESSFCRTDFSNLSPSKATWELWSLEKTFKYYLLNFPSKCLPEFKVKNQTVTNCTKEPLGIDDVTRPCGLFMRELEFMKLWEEKKNIDRGDAKYYLMNIDDLSNKNESPIEIDIQQVKSQEIHKYNRYIYI